MTVFDKKETSFLISLLVLCVLGTLLILFTTAPWGIGFSADPVAYLSLAREMLAGHGYQQGFAVIKPETQWPPLYPLALAASGLAGMDLKEGARLLQAVLFGLNGFLIGLITQKASRSAVLGLTAPAAVMLVPVMLEVHVMAYSEPLFFVFALAGFFFLYKGIEAADCRKFLGFAATCFALACLDRYAGIFVIAAGALSILIFLPKNFWVKTGTAFTFALLSALPLGLWLIRNHRVAGDVAARSVSFHLPDVSRLNEAVSTAGLWIVPFKVRLEVSYGIVAAAVVLLTGFAVLLLRSNPKNISEEAMASFRGLKRVFELSSIFSFSYLVLIVLYMVFASANMRQDHRLLSPLYLFSVLALFSLMGALYFAHRQRKWVLPALSLLLFSVLFVNVTAVQKDILAIHRRGIGYSSPRWEKSPTVLAIQDIPAKARIYSNGPDVIYLLTGRNAARLPKKHSYYHDSMHDNEKKQDKFEKDIQKLAQKAALHKIYIVFFKKRYRWYHVRPEDLKAYFPLEQWKSYEDGEIYQINLLA